MNTNVMDSDAMSEVMAEVDRVEAATRPLHVYVIGPDSYIAHDEDDVWVLLEKQTGFKKGDDDIGDDEPILVPDDKPLKIMIEEGRPETETLTAAEWCAREGRGFLCSTEW